jgi:hypothetical protein
VFVKALRAANSATYFSGLQCRQPAAVPRKIGTDSCFPSERLRTVEVCWAGDSSQAAIGGMQHAHPPTDICKQQRAAGITNTPMTYCYQAGQWITIRTNTRIGSCCDSGWLKCKRNGGGVHIQASIVQLMLAATPATPANSHSAALCREHKQLTLHPHKQRYITHSSLSHCRAQRATALAGRCLGLSQAAAASPQSATQLHLRLLQGLNRRLCRIPTCPSCCCRSHCHTRLLFE